MLEYGWTFNFFVILTATVHAILEIQIEGEHGWAENLPTTKIKGKIISIFSEHEYVTGFHIATVLLVTILAHFPLLFIPEWTFKLEAIVLAFVILHFTIEDFLWFVFNPAFGIQKFKKKHIWWHTHWLFGLPVSYWVAIPVVTVLLVIGSI